MITSLVVIACHFKSKSELCATTIKRLETALQKSRTLPPAETHFVVGGNVPYEKGGPTLQQLMKEWLLRHGAVDALFNSGTGTFSEARETLKDIAIRPGVNIVVVSSDWWLWSGAPIWRRFGRPYGRKVETLAVRGTGGWRTRLVYAAYAAVVRASFLLGCSPFVEKHLNRMQAKRLEGFTWNGCA